MCEQLGQLPDPDKMPLEVSVFPDEVQVAFFVFNLLSDRWDGNSGMYLGKDWAQCDQIFQLYDIDDRRYVMYFAKLYEAILMNHRAEQQEQRRKAEERKAKQKQQAGKTYTHNVRG